jgi:Relaxase/Mobilisation nuclease domain
VIIKGTSCAGAFRLATHLTRTDTNERAEVKEIRGSVAEDLLGAFREMEAVAAGTRTTKPFYHASINTRADEPLTDEQRVQAIDRLEAELKLYGQARVVVIHEKEGREHCHIVWSRIDLDRMTAISDSHNYRKHEEVARSLEREFGHERVQGAHVEREGKDRPERTPSHREMLQSERTGISTEQAKELMTGIWKSTKNGKEFQATLEEKGWMLARGDRRDFVAIDPHGGVHSIARRVEGAKAADVRQRFADIDPKSLVSVAEAKQVQRKRNGGHERQAAGKQRTSEARPPSKVATPARGPKAARGGPRLRPSGGKAADSMFSALMGESPAPKPKQPDPARDDAVLSQRRQELMRQLSREIPQETERDAEIERDRGRQRDRG